MHEGHRDRLRERFREQGADSLADHELLELFLFSCIPRRDTNPIAHRLLAHFGTLHAVLTASEEELTEVEGIGPNCALQLQLIEQIERRCDLDTFTRLPLDTRGTLSSYCMALLRGLRYEKFYALMLDARFHLICARCLASGLPDQLMVHPRAVAEAALRSHAVHVVLTHNHPAGNSTPSTADIDATVRIRDALEALGICLNEHIIVTEEDAFAVCAGEAMPRSLLPSPRRARAAQNTGIFTAEEAFQCFRCMHPDEVDKFMDMMGKYVDGSPVK